MLSIEQASQIVQNNLIEYVHFKHKPDSLYNPVSYILDAGGKRLRPSLLLMSCSIFSENHHQAVLPAIGIEVFHNFTLVHDDIMDNSDFRRNKMAIHKKWNNNVAILSGDVMMMLAAECFSDLNADTYKKTLPVFLKTGREVCEGQQFDMDFESRSDVSVAEYINMIRLKTAVLIGASLKIGAIIGGASLEQSDLIYEVGINMGLSFQLRDDYLDIYSNQNELGKPIGNDILNKKKTLLFLQALSKSNNLQKEYLNSVFSDSYNPTKDDIEKVKEIYNQLEIPNYIESEINNLNAIAIEKLSLLNLPSESYYELTQMIHKLGVRTF